VERPSPGSPLPYGERKCKAVERPSPGSPLPYGERVRVRGEVDSVINRTAEKKGGEDENGYS